MISIRFKYIFEQNAKLLLSNRLKLYLSDKGYPLIRNLTIFLKD